MAGNGRNGSLNSGRVKGFASRDSFSEQESYDLRLRSPIRIGFRFVDRKDLELAQEIRGASERRITEHQGAASMEVDLF
jgi:hypothetical protein